MGTFLFSTVNRITQPTTRLYLDGVLRPDLYPNTIAHSQGLGGKALEILAPQHVFDDAISEFKGAEVVLYSSNSGSSFLGAEPVFVGYVDQIQSTLNPGETQIRMSARSPVSFFDQVHIGEERELPEVRYPARAVRSGVLQETKWNAKGILQDWFTSSAGPTWKGGGGGLPSNWRAKVKLGSLSDVDDDGVPIGDQIFRASSLAQGLMRLLDFLGDVSFEERFTAGGVTYLDFYKVGDPASPKKTIKLGVAGTSIVASQSNVESLSQSTNLDAYISRVRVLGAPRRTMISIATDHSTAPLDKWWDSSLETAVLADPESTLKDNASGESDISRQAWTQQKQFVFRRYRLPQFLRDQIREGRINIASDNILEDSDGRQIGVQVWRIPRILAAGAGPPDIDSTLGTSPVLEEGVSLHLESGWFMLGAPAVELVDSTQNAQGLIVDTFEEAKIGITFTVELNQRTTHDTGDPSNPVFSGIGDDGLSMKIINESFRHESIGNDSTDFALEDETGTNHLFTNVWFYLDDNAISPYSVGWNNPVAAVTIHDDRVAIQSFAGNTLRQASQQRVNFSVKIPYFTKGFRLGDRITIANHSNPAKGVHQIRSVSQNFIDPETIISTDNQRPLSTDERHISGQGQDLTNAPPGVVGSAPGVESSDAEFNFDPRNAMHSQRYTPRDDSALIAAQQESARQYATRPGNFDKQGNPDDIDSQIQRHGVRSTHASQRRAKERQGQSVRFGVQDSKGTNRN